MIHERPVKRKTVLINPLKRILDWHDLRNRISITAFDMSVGFIENFLTFPMNFFDGYTDSLDGKIKNSVTVGGTDSRALSSLNRKKKKKKEREMNLVAIVLRDRDPRRIRYSDRAHVRKCCTITGLSPCVWLYTELQTYAHNVQSRVK